MDKEKENNSEIDLSKSFGDSGVKFQKETRSSKYVFYPGTPKIIQWLIKYSGGLIKNENLAACVLIGLLALAMIISLILFFGRGGVKTQKTFTPPAEAPIEEVIPPAF